MGLPVQGKIGLGAYPPAPMLTVRREIPVELRGASKPRVVVAGNGKKYIAKSDTWHDGPHPSHVLYQEYVGARIANAIGLPIPDFAILRYDGGLCFGSLWMDVTIRHFDIDALDKVANQDVVYALAAFDGWIRNWDRHSGNLIVCREKKTQKLYAIDHSHAPLKFGSHKHHLQGLKTEPIRKFLQSWIYSFLPDRDKLDTAISKIMGLSDLELRGLSEPPPGAKPDSLSHQQLMYEFLQHRRDNLADMFKEIDNLLPAKEVRE